MSKNRVIDSLGRIDEDMVQEVESLRHNKKRPVWMKWGAMAACLCLVVCISVFQPWENEHKPGVGGSDVGSMGQFPDGVDPIIASKAVYPANESLTDVSNATIEDISEADIYGLNGISSYVPNELPNGYVIVNASLYETTMNNGTQYHLLRITYGRGTGSQSNPVIVDGDTEKEVKANAPVYEEIITVSIWDHKPDTERNIYTQETLPEDISNGRTFHISVGDVYVGISATGATNEDAMAVLNSIIR